jgi:hypothetical protein
VPPRSYYSAAPLAGSVRMSFNTCSQSASGLRSPALARAMILLAMACLTSSCVHRVRQWAALFLRPSKKMRPRPRNKTRPHASAFVSLSRGERNRSTGSSSQGPLGSAPEWPLADSCCTRATSGHAAAPPSSVMNWRRLRSSMGSSPEPAVPAYSRRRMPRKHPQVLGIDLNRSDGRVRGLRPRPTSRLSPQIAYRQKFLNLSGASSV